MRVLPSFPGSLLRELRWADCLLLVGLSILAFAAWSRSRQAEGDRLLVEVTQEGKRSLYPIDQDLDLRLRNAAGRQVMLVKVQGSQVRVQESDCPLQYCVQRGAISRVGQWIACLPNQVFIRVLAARQHAVHDPFRLDAEVF